MNEQSNCLAKFWQDTEECILYGILYDTDYQVNFWARVLSTRQLKVWIISVYHNLHFEYVGWWGGCLFSLFVALLCLANYFDKTLRHFGKWGSSFPLLVVMPFRSHSERTVKLSWKNLARHRRVYPVRYPIWYWLPGQLLSKGIKFQSVHKTQRSLVKRCIKDGILYVHDYCSSIKNCQQCNYVFTTPGNLGWFNIVIGLYQIDNGFWIESKIVRENSFISSLQPAFLQHLQRKLHKKVKWTEWLIWLAKFWQEMENCMHNQIKLIKKSHWKWTIKLSCKLLTKHKRLWVQRCNHQLRWDPM